MKALDSGRSGGDRLERIQVSLSLTGYGTFSTRSCWGPSRILPETSYTFTTSGESLMKTGLGRRLFVRQLVSLPAWGFAGAVAPNLLAQRPVPRAGGSQIKLSLNAYSFNTPLREGKTNLEEVLDFCARENFDGADLTGYYFPGHPARPSKEYISRIKKRAYHLGIGISGTGVRNDFATPDLEKRRADILHVQEWLEVAAELGAPALRVFAGRELADGASRPEAVDRVVEGLQICAEKARELGVVMVLQNHAEFLKTADQVKEILARVDSEWLALNLDIGSFPVQDPYSEIEVVAPYSTTWQIKEFVHVGDEQVPTDLDRVMKILKDVAFRGYILLETLGPGDPWIRVPQFLARVREALGRVA